MISAELHCFSLQTWDLFKFHPVQHGSCESSVSVETLSALSACNLLCVQAERLNPDLPISREFPKDRPALCTASFFVKCNMQSEATTCFAATLRSAMHALGDENQQPPGQNGLLASSLHQMKQLVMADHRCCLCKDCPLFMAINMTLQIRAPAPAVSLFLAPACLPVGGAGGGKGGGRGGGGVTHREAT